MISVSRIAPFILLNEGLGFSDLSGSPMCVNGMKLLIHARDSDGIPLTRSGAFFRKFVAWAAESFHWPEYEAEKLYVANKVLNEPDFFPLAVMHDLLLGARLMRHYNGKAVLTKTGKAMIGDYGALQAEMFDTFFIALDHSAYERFPIDYDDADIRHFLGVIQNRLGDWVTLADFASWCLPLDAIRKWRISPKVDACFYLTSRVVRPLIWLGLLEQAVDERRMVIEERLIRRTPLFDRFVRVSIGQSDRWSIH